MTVNAITDIKKGRTGIAPTYVHTTPRLNSPLSAEKIENGCILMYCDICSSRLYATFHNHWIQWSETTQHYYILKVDERTQ